MYCFDHGKVFNSYDKGRQNLLEISTIDAVSVNFQDVQCTIKYRSDDKTVVPFTTLTDSFPLHIRRSLKDNHNGVIKANASCMFS